MRWEKVSTPDEAFDAIKSMKIRGAPAIASLAALSLRSHLGAHPPFSSASEVSSHVLPICDYLQSARPTAVNLSEAMNRVRATLTPSASTANGHAQTNGHGHAEDPAQLVEKVKDVCWAVHEEDLARNMEMGRLGAEWLWKKRRGTGEGKGLKVLTVCNTGSLATSVSGPFSDFCHSLDTCSS